MDIKTYTNRLNRIRVLNTENKDFINKDLYRLLLQDHSLLYGYEKIKSNKGALTPSITEDTLDGFGRPRLEKLKSALTSESWTPRPARRKYIPKPGKKELRPLGVQGPEEKIVQAAMLTILECIYEPIFSENSFGFRPYRGAHDALKRISQQYDAVNFAIEGDIKGMYDNVNHKVLIELLEKKIKDARFIRLLWKLLGAGYFEEDIGVVKPITGTPQGSIVSPILANIYLHELDMFMQNKCTTRKTRTKCKTPIYHKKSYQVKIIKKKLGALEEGSTDKRDLVKKLKQYQADLLKTRMYKNSDPRIYYSRYADDFIIGIAGSIKLAEEIKSQVKDFLFTKLNLTLSLEKTKLTNLKVRPALYLGHEILIDTSVKLKVMHVHGRTPFPKRVTGSFVKLRAPMKLIISNLEKKGFCNTVGFPTPKKIWTTQGDSEIVRSYKATISGLFNYYKGCNYQNRLNRIWYILKCSCAMTLAKKHKSSMNKMFKEHGQLLGVKFGPKGEKYISLTKPSTCEGDKRWFTGQTVKDPFSYVAFRLTASKIDECCCICAESSAQMHHIRHVRKSRPGEFAHIMGIINRKQIPVCLSCHNKIHSGKYDESLYAKHRGKSLCEA